MAFETYAVVHEATDYIDVNTASRILAPLLGCVRQDLITDLGKRPGFLAAGVSKETAREAESALRSAGMDVRVVAESRLAEPPAFHDVTRGVLQPEGFRVRLPRGDTLLRWNDLLFVDVVRTRRDARSWRQTGLSSGNSGDDGRDELTSLLSARTTLESEEFVYAVCCDPWLGVRIAGNRFSYAACGLPVGATRNAGLRALAGALKSKTRKAAHGAGLAAAEGGPAAARQVLKREVYENDLIWRLQLRLCKEENDVRFAGIPRMDVASRLASAKRARARNWRTGANVPTRARRFDLGEIVIRFAAGAVLGAAVGLAAYLLLLAPEENASEPGFFEAYASQGQVMVGIIAAGAFFGGLIAAFRLFRD